MSEDVPAAGALSGLRVIDLTQVLAGPFCTQILADHGADVVKIEPLRGDETRHLGPYRADDPEREIGGYYQSVNRNKRSIAVDLKAEEGRALVLRLVKGADAIVENYRPGVMDRLGLSYETLAESNPRIVYAAIRGFGDPRSGETAYTYWPAFDVVAQAMGGMMGITGYKGEPLKVGPGVGDLIPAVMTAFGIVAALLEAQRSGRGQFVDVGMVDAILSVCERIVHQHSYVGAIPGPEGNRHPLLCPFGLFKAADGWVALGAPHVEFWRNVCAIIGRPELAEDPRFAQCAAIRFYRYFHQHEDVPLDRIAELQESFTDSGYDAKGLVREIVLHDDFRVAAGVTDDAAEALVGVKKARPFQLGRLMRDLTGFRWELDVSLIPDLGAIGTIDLSRNATIGFNVLGGAGDSFSTLGVADTVNATTSLFLRQLASESASFVVEQDFGEADPDARALLSLVEPEDTAEAVVRDQLAWLFLRLYAERVEPDSEEVDDIYAVFDGVLAATDDPMHAWKATLTAMLQDPAVLFY